MFVGARGSASARRAATALRHAASTVHWDRKTVAGVAAGVLALGGAGAGVLLTPVTQVSGVVVEAAPDSAGQPEPPALGAAEQRAITGAAGPTIGKPLVKVDIAGVEQRVSALGRYRRVEVSRQWPDALRIRVLHRVPVLAVPAEGKRVELVDEYGIAYEKVAKVPAGLPVAQLMDVRDIAQRQAAVAAVAALTVQRRAQLNGLEVSSDAQVTMSLGGVEVQWGGVDENQLKAAVVAALVERSGIRTLDVRAPHRPVTTS